MEYVLSKISLPNWQVAFPKKAVLAFALHVWEHFVPRHTNNYQPHLLRGRALGLFSILILSVKVFTFSALAFAPVSEVYSSAITPENILSLTNLSRQSFGLSQLSVNEKLAEAAQAKANDMRDRAYFSHTSPDGKQPWNFIEATGYKYLVAGENLAINFFDADNMEEAWMNSPGHKANILNKNFEETGVGISQGEFGGRQTVFVVQMFGVASEQNVRLTFTPTEVQKSLVPEPSLSSEKNLEFKISNIETKLENEKVFVSATVSETAVKVLVKYGEKAVMLKPNSGGVWQGEIPVASLAGTGYENLNLVAEDIKGKTETVSAGSVSNSAKENFNLLSSPLPQTAQVLGVTFKPVDFEQKLTLWVVFWVLLTLAIGFILSSKVFKLKTFIGASLVVMFLVLLI